MSREHFFYGALVGAGAVALGCVAGLASVRLWRSVRCHHEAGGHHHGHGHGHGEEDDFGSCHMKSFLLGQYAPPEDLMMFPFVPRDSLEFSHRCAELCIKHKQEGIISRALEVGCACGRTTFELARGYDEVVGLDLSQLFLDKCNEIKETGKVEYWLPSEGELGETKMATLDPSIDRSRVQFMQGDACNLPPLEKFGCVFCSNILCTIDSPKKFLQSTKDLVVPGGILVMAENYGRHGDAHDDKSSWLGGYKDRDGREVKAMDTVMDLLSPHFDLVEAFDMPAITPEEQRLWFWVVDHATVWKRKEEEEGEKEEEDEEEGEKEEGEKEA